MSETAGWLDQFHETTSPLETALAASAQEDVRERLQAEREQAEREAAREQRLEAMTFAERQLGGPLAEMSRAQQAMTAAGEEVADLQAQLAKAEAKLARARSNLEFFASRSAQAANLASRSWTPSGDPLERASHEAHRMFREATRAMWADATAGRPTRAPRPFVSGTAVRSEPVTCEACKAIGATADESFLIHHTDAEGRPVAVDGETPVKVPPDDTERSAWAGREITRVVDGESYGSMSTLAGISVR
jgi:hypothetical protein